MIKTDKKTAYFFDKSMQFEKAEKWAVLWVWFKPFSSLIRAQAKRKIELR